MYALFVAGHQKEARLWDGAYHGWWSDAVTGSSGLQLVLRLRASENFRAGDMVEQSDSAYQRYRGRLLVEKHTRSFFRSGIH